MKRFALFLAAAAFASVATFAVDAGAQVIYEPVRFQYFASPGHQNVYYYGGTDPLAHRFATMNSVDQSFGRVQGYAFFSSTRQVAQDRAPAYSDSLPYVDVAPAGYTPNDARNAAYRSLPTYFRKADLLRAAVRQADGSWVVPDRGTLTLSAAPAALAPVAAQPRGVILIIPKPPKAPASNDLKTILAAG